MIEPQPPSDGAQLRAMLARIEQFEVPAGPKPRIYPTSRLTFEKRGRE